MLTNISTKIQIELEHKDAVREQTLRLCRETIRACGTAIKSIHRGDYSAGKKLLAIAGDSISRISIITKEHQDIYHSGYVVSAQQEYTEAAVVLDILENATMPDPDTLGVEYGAYLCGLADAVGELRRYVLDSLRLDRKCDFEKMLDTMDSIYTTLMSFDYPDAITKGLRRKTDVARALVEKTRGDLTIAHITTRID